MPAVLGDALLPRPFLLVSRLARWTACVIVLMICGGRAKQVIWMV